MSIKATGGPTHRLRVTRYWGPRRWTEGLTDPLSIRVVEGPTFWWGSYILAVHLGLWGSHTLSSEDPQIDSPSRPLRAPYIDSEPRRTEGPAYWWGPHRSIVQCPSKPQRAPHIYWQRASPYRGPHILTSYLQMRAPLIDCPPRPEGHTHWQRATLRTSERSF